MKLNPDWLTKFAYDHSTIPRIEAISAVDKYQKKGVGPDYPENWFIRLNVDAYEIFYPHMTRGIYALTRAGWNANRGALQQAYLDNTTKHPYSYQFFSGSWEQYEAALEHRFTRIEQLVTRDVDILEKSLAMAKQNLVYQNQSVPINPKTQHIMFLRADRAQVMGMLAERDAQTDPIGHFQFTERLRQIEDELRSLGVTDFT